MVLFNKTEKTITSVKRSKKNFKKTQSFCVTNVEWKSDTTADVNNKSKTLNLKKSAKLTTISKFKNMKTFEEVRKIFVETIGGEENWRWG